LALCAQDQKNVTQGKIECQILELEMSELKKEGVLKSDNSLKSKLQAEVE